MIRALWFLIQIGLIVAGALWLLERPGEITLSAFGYTITAQTGLFLLALVAGALILFSLFRVLAAVFSIPSDVGGFFFRRKRRKGWRDVTRGLSAVAAGDARQADLYARRVKSALPEEGGIAQLLIAQAARMNGRDDEARSAYEVLMKDKDAAYLGLRGLMTSAVEANDSARALIYARQALAQFPKQDRILKTAYELEIKNAHWDEALNLLKRAEKIKTVTADQARADRVALYVLRADEAKKAGDDSLSLSWIEKAHKTDPFFVPVITRLAEIYKKNGKDRKIQGMVEKAFPIAPHPDLAVLWDFLAPQAGDKKDPVRVMRWYEKLVSMNAQTDISHLAAARAAMTENLLGEARAYLKHAEKISTSPALYRLKAALEEKSGSDAATIRAVVEQAADAPPAKTWVCRETGRTYAAWSPIALPHGAFNTIIWDYPGVRAAHAPALEKRDLLIDAA